MGFSRSMTCKPRSFANEQPLLSEDQVCLLAGCTVWGVKMTTLPRWRKAQAYEQKFWKNLESSIETGTIRQLNWYSWKASELERRLSRYMLGRGKTENRVLEIGAGPIGIVNFLEWGERFAVDPLEDFYKQSSTLTKLRKPGVAYLQGTGESLPYAERFFSLVIIDNVIDHTHAPYKVLQEIYRVLDIDAFLYVAVNIRTTWGAMVHKLLAALYIDKGHPHTFTKESIRDLLKASNFKIRAEEIEDYQKVKRQYRLSAIVRDKIKGYTGISEFLYHAICQKVTTR